MYFFFNRQILLKLNVIIKNNEEEQTTMPHIGVTSKIKTPEKRQKCPQEKDKTKKQRKLWRCKHRNSVHSTTTSLSLQAPKTGSPLQTKQQLNAKEKA